MKKILFLLIVLIAALSVSSCVNFDTRGIDASAAENSVVYIDTEKDFTDFVLNSLGSGAAGTTYVLRTDIYLDRYYESGGKNFYLNIIDVTLDGRGHAVVGYRNSSENAFFVNYVSAGGVLKDLNLVDVALGSSSSIYAAPINSNAGTVSGFNVTASVRALGEFGFVKDNSGVIENSFAAVDFYSGAIGVSGAENAEGALFALTNTGAVTDSFACDLGASFTDDVLDTAGSTGTILHAAAPSVATDLAELTYLTYNGGATLGSFVNLYNTSALSEEQINAADAAGYGFYNASSFGEEYPVRAGGDALLGAATAFGSGSGTEADPFVISSPEELLLAAGGEEHYMLTANIDLSAYEISWSVLGDFNGVLYGNGHALTGVKVPLTTSLGGRIADIYVGADLNAAQSLFGTLSGSLYNVNIAGTGGSVALLDNGAAEEVGVASGFAAAFASGSVGVVNRVFSYAESFVAGTENSALTVTGSYQYNGAWNGANESGSVDGETSATYENVSEYIAPKASDIYSGKLSCSGWGWGNATFGVERGTSLIIPVIPSERRVYKSNPVITVSDGTHAYGAGSETVTHYFIDENGSYRLSGYELSKAAVYEVIDSFFTVDLDHAAFKWYTSVGTEVVSDGFTANSTDADTVYTLKFTDTDGDYYIGVTLSARRFESADGTVTSEWTLKGVMTEYLYNLDKLAYAAGAEDIRVALEALGLDADPSNPFGYAGVTLSVTDASGTAAEEGIKEVGVYYLTISVPASYSANATEIALKYTVTTGSLGDLTQYELVSETADGYDGQTEAGAPTYNGSAIEATFELVDFPYAAVISYTIASFVSVSGVKEPPAVIRDAGRYYLEIVVSVHGYAPVSLFTSYYVLRAEEEVTAGNISAIPYGSEHPFINLNPDFSYESDYSRFSAPGIYTVTPVQVKDNDNYVYTVKSSTFEVYGVTLSSEDVQDAFVSATLTYDGGKHTLTLDPSKIRLVEGDPYSYTFTVEYYYDGKTYDVPPEFTDAGIYSFGLKFKSVSPANYSCGAELTATLEILRFEVNATVGNVAVAYGAPVPEYSVVFSAVKGELPNVDVDSEIVAGVHYALTCDYTPESAANSTHEVGFERLSEPVNFRIVGVRSGVLSVGKKPRESFSIVQTYVYNAEPVSIRFTGDVSEMEFVEGYPQYGVKREDGNELLDGAPSLATPENAKYVVFVKLKESENYQAFEGEFEFVIEKYSPSPEVYVYVPSGEGEQSIGTLDEQNNFEFDGTRYSIRAVYDGEYEVSFTYTVNGESASSGNYLSFLAPVSVKDLTLIMTPLNDNFAPYTHNFGSFTIAKKYLYVKKYSFSLIYRASEYSAEELLAAAESAGVLDSGDYVQGFEPLFGLTVSGAACLPGDYTLTISGDANYEISADVSLTILPAEVTLDFSDRRFVLEYGSVNVASDGKNAYFTSTENYVLGDNTFSAVLNLRIGYTDIRSPEPGTYDVTAADPVTVSGITVVGFTVANGSGKVDIVRREISLLWEEFLSSSALTYDGDPVDFSPMSGNRTYILNCAANAPTLGFTISAGDGISAGEHTVRAELQGESANRYRIAEGNSEHTFTVAPKTLVYSVSSVTIYSDEAVPGAFAVTYVSETPLASDAGALGESFYLDREFEPYVKAEYSVFMRFDGAKGSNYVLEKAGEDGELKVVYRSFDPAVNVVSIYVVYTGLPVEIPISNAELLPAGATVFRSITPADAGRYGVIVRVEAAGYEAFEKSAEITVAPAEVEITNAEGSIYFDVSHVVGASDLVGVTAAFNGAAVAGSVGISETDITLNYGLNDIPAVFEPDSDNFVSKAFTYRLNAVADLDKLRLYDVETSFVLPQSGTVVTDNPTFTLVAEFPEEWGDLAKLYVNGAEVLSPNVYVFTNDAENVSIEIRIGEAVVYSALVGIDVNDTPYVPPESGDGDGSGGQQTNPEPGGDIHVSVSEETRKALIIAGSVAGGLIVAAGIAVLIAVIIKKNKGKGKR